MSKQEKELERLRAQLDAQGGRGVELAEEIDDLACELGQCVYGSECEREDHQPDPEGLAPHDEGYLDSVR